MAIRELVDRILRDGKITQREHQDLLMAIRADGEIDAEENEQVERVIGKVRSGEIEVV